MATPSIRAFSTATCSIERHLSAPDATLEEGQQAKLRTICERLELGPEDHLLEIGTGWGGSAHAARHYGCRVTTTTISQAQHDYAKAWIEREGAGDRITLLLEDYRKLEGRCDKLVSIEMIEAVGHAFPPDYFRQLSRLLKPGGRLLIQAITIADQRHAQYLRKTSDFIQRYIFPGGCLPCVSQMAGLLARETDMQLVRLHDHGHHYARTLAHWCERFLALAPELPELGYSQDFIRLWHFYFAYREGGFWERAISLVQLEAPSRGPMAGPGLPASGR